MPRDEDDFSWMKDGSWRAKTKYRHAIFSNRFDKEDIDRMLKEVSQFAAARTQLGDFTPTGEEAISDAFLALYKGVPLHREVEEMDTEYLINHRVMQELSDMQEIERLRRFCVGDEVQAALSIEEIEPELEMLFDRTLKEQEQLNDLKDLLEQLAQAKQDKQDADDAIEAFLAAAASSAEGDGEGEDGDGEGSAQSGDADGEGEPQEGEGEGPGEPEIPENLITDQKSAQERLDALNEATEKLLAQLQDVLDQIGSETRMILRPALARAEGKAREVFDAGQAWGMSPGELHRLPAEERLELAKRLNTPHFRKIAELFGPMKNIMFTEQQRKTIHANDEIFDVTLGNNLSRLLPSELLMLDQNEDDFLLRYSEGKLLEYDMRGVESLSKGGIIVCKDCSGSMNGVRSAWATAVMLCLLHLARQQKREFHVIHFSSSYDPLVHLAFRRPEDFSIQNILDAAELHYGGGTDFEPPLVKAMEILNDQHKRTGAVSADVIFITDDECYVENEFMENYLAEAERLQFTTFGFAITNRPPKEDGALAQMSEKKVFHINDLLSGEEIRSCFAAL